VPLLTIVLTAEAYYTADYPENELDSDDELGFGAYNYRNDNASDEEEYLGVEDEDDIYGYTHEDELDEEESIVARARRFNHQFGVAR
jgi:hypothetical protein